MEHNKEKDIKLVWTLPKTASQYICKNCIKRSYEICKTRSGKKLTWIKMVGIDLETAEMMVAKEDGTIFVATDQYLANNPWLTALC